MKHFRNQTGDRWSLGFCNSRESTLPPEMGGQEQEVRWPTSRRWGHCESWRDGRVFRGNWISGEDSCCRRPLKRRRRRTHQLLPCLILLFPSGASAWLHSGKGTWQCSLPHSAHFLPHCTLHRPVILKARWGKEQETDWRVLDPHQDKAYCSPRITNLYTRKPNYLL